ncbi:MAG: glycosyltransferase family 9 protein [Chitinispirillaceae bacterium]|nr:glycosyltransferase family 9 protein [Chitinispirillaceae bacterium]
MPVDDTHTSPSRFLLIQTAFTGDTILATAVIEKLKASFPHPVIDLMVRKGNEGLFDHHPHLRSLYVWDKHKGTYRQFWPLLIKIRRKHYDFCINLHRHHTMALITLLSGARETIGFSTSPLSRFFTRRCPYAINPAAGLTHEVDLFLKLLTGIVPGTGRSMPRLYPSQEDFEGVTIDGPYVTVAPTSVWFTKQYPPEKWVKVIDLLDPAITVCLIGGAPDREACEWIREHSRHPKVENRAGTLTFLRSAALITKARMNYVNDSAPLHIASAVGAPVTAVFCSTIPAFGFGPLGDNGRVVETKEALPCRPCGSHGHKQCPEGHFRCADIGEERVAGDRS